MKTGRKQLLACVGRLLVLALLPFMASAAQAGTNGLSAKLPACCQKLESSAPLSDQSVYQLTSDWTNDAGREIKLTSLRGKPQVVAMIFTSCRGACPILLHQIQQLAKTLPPAIGTNVGFLLVTFDTEHDTAAVLHEYRAARHLPGEQWTLLRGSAEDTRELSLVLGVKYRKDSSGQFSHSNLLTILNAEGEIAFQQSGLDNSGEELNRRLTQLFKP
jgi:protein SCO1